MGKKVSDNGLLLLKKDDEKKEIEFELQYLLSLTIQERFQLMQRKSREMLALLEQNGHGNKITAKFGITEVYFPCLDDMIRMKKAAGRAKDLEDLKYLKKIKAKKK